MVTDKQKQTNKQTKGKTKRKKEGYWRSKIPQQIYVGLGPKQGRCLQKILFWEQNFVKYDWEFSERKTSSNMTESFFKSKLRQVWLRVFREQNFVKYDWEFSRANCVKYNWEFFKSQLRQIWLLIFSRHPSSKSLLAPSSWDRVDDPQLAEVVLKPTYCWSCYVADVRERAADQITK